LQSCCLPLATFFWCIILMSVASRDYQQRPRTSDLRSLPRKIRMLGRKDWILIAGGSRCWSRLRSVQQSDAWVFRSPEQQPTTVEHFQRTGSGGRNCVAGALNAVGGGGAAWRRLAQDADSLGSWMPCSARRTTRCARSGTGQLAARTELKGSGPDGCPV